MNKMLFVISLIFSIFSLDAASHQKKYSIHPLELAARQDLENEKKKCSFHPLELAAHQNLEQEKKDKKSYTFFSADDRYAEKRPSYKKFGSISCTGTITPKEDCEKIYKSESSKSEKKERESEETAITPDIIQRMNEQNRLHIEELAQSSNIQELMHRLENQKIHLALHKVTGQFRIMDHKDDLREDERLGNIITGSTREEVKQKYNIED